MKQFIAALIGTFILVFFACGTAVIAGAQVGILGIALAFGLALIAAAYGIGAISGGPGAQRLGCGLRRWLRLACSILL